MVRFRAGDAESRFTPTGPDFVFRPVDGAAAALDRRWTRSGERLTTLVPISLPGLKTRFDELLVDEDRDRLLARVTEFLSVDASGLEAFARRWALDGALFAKLRATRTHSAGARPSEEKVRRFLRYRGPSPMGRPAWCYVDRLLIPRGDHRLRGEYDPHAGAVKLVFNVHELPLAARVVDEPGCVTAYRHSRFAPLVVPKRIRDEGLDASRGDGDLGPPVPNLSPRGLEWAAALGSPRKAFDAIARFINSEPVQRRWAPAYGASRTLHVPLPAPGVHGRQLELLEPEP